MAIIGSWGGRAAEEAGCDCEKEKQPALLLAANNAQEGSGKSPKVAGGRSQTADAPKYLDPQAPIEARIDDLLPRMTLEEKIIQLKDSWGSPGIPRLKIPAMFKTEGLHSQSYSSGATLFPMPIEMAGTFDPELIYQVGKATAVEAKAANIRVSWSPVLDLARDARWGRVEETYGEDPFLVGRMGVAWIGGFQSQDMIAVPKHFAGHGEPLGGRDSHDVGLSDRTMRELHLKPFRAAIKEAHAGGVMAAYSTWDGTPANGSTELLQSILRQEWGFDGFVVSDCGGPEHFLNKQSVVGDLKEACQLAIRAGVNIECGDAYNKALAATVQDGLLTEAELDTNVRDVLRAKFKLGLFENLGPQRMVWEKLPAYDTPEHRALAREVAVRGSALLKNANRLLPLSKDLKTIAVIGPNADQAQQGDYSPKPDPDQMITVLQGVKSHVGPGTKVLYAKGCDALSGDTSGIAPAVDLAKQADVVILVVGDHSYNDKEKNTTGENVDGAMLEIPGVQRELIKQVQATGKPVVLVLVNGKPFTLQWEVANIPAILETWYPGEEGGNATADIIFGDRNPSGRLPITILRSPGQLPLCYNYMPSGRNYDYYDLPFTPQYRFGHGLSYTSFRYSDLKIVTRENDPGYATVSVDIENVGDRDGDEVAQLYVTDMQTSVITPVIELKGVKRVSLKKGAKETVRFNLTPYELSYLNAAMERVIEPATFRVHVGGVSPEPPSGSEHHKAKIGFKNPAEGISGEFVMPRAYQADFAYDLNAPVRVEGGKPFAVTVTVTNKGNLLDIARVNLYGTKLLDSHRFEIESGQSHTCRFEATLYESGTQGLTVIVGKQAITKTIKVIKSPANLTLSNVKMSIGDDGVLHYKARARNTGGEVYQKDFNILLDGKIAAKQKVHLAGGAQQVLEFDCAFPRPGTFRVKLGDAPEQQMVMPGGVSLVLSDPLIYLDFDGGKASGAKNAINGSVLPVQGAPQFVPGKEGLAFETASKDTFVKAEGVDLYRKSFTLAAWVNIQNLVDQQAMFFGGQAPMGADVDTTGTGLAAGILGGRPLLSFWNRDTHSANKIRTGDWMHVAYTYDSGHEEGAIYLNGKLDKKGGQKSYAGPLDIIGGAMRFNHGAFAIDDVLVAHGCLDSKAIAALMERGVQGLQAGEIVTDWRPVEHAFNTIETRSELPDGASITIVIETGNGKNSVVDSKTVSVRAGNQSISLAGLNLAETVRLRVQLKATKWSKLPALQSVSLLGGTDPVRWSTVAEWRKCTASGGAKLEL